MSRAYKCLDPEGIYFVTFTTIGWIDVFTRREYKDIIVSSLQFCTEKKGMLLYAWCIMSNHIHLIIGSEKNDVPGVVRDMKKHTSTELIDAIKNNPQESRKEWMLNMFGFAGRVNPNNKNYQLWQQNYQPELLYSNEFMQQKLDYIHMNPVTAGCVDEPQYYLYSSARDYCGERGLVDVTLLE